MVYYMGDFGLSMRLSRFRIIVLRILSFSTEVLCYSLVRSENLRVEHILSPRWCDNMWKHIGEHENEMRKNLVDRYFRVRRTQEEEAFLARKCFEMALVAEFKDLRSTIESLWYSKFGKFA